MKGFFNGVVDSYKKEKQERIIRETERKLAEAKAKEEQLLAQKQAIQEEKDRLMKMDQKELLAEAILAIRGFYEDYKIVLLRLGDAEDDIVNLQEEVASLKRDLSDMNGN